MPVPSISHKRILVSVLNWGMGHASRTGVLIGELIKQHNTVEIVSSGIAYNYLKLQFPSLNIYNLNFPELIYPSHSQLWMSLLMQQKKILGAVKQENAWVKKYLESNPADLIVSDNCYGFYSPNVHSVFLTHQLNLKAPFFEKKLNRKIQSLIEPFNEIWIPDVETALNLAGSLAHPAHPSKPCTYIGPLSALSKKNMPLNYKYCAVISGPEKQRTVFENMVIDFLNKENQPSVLVRGVFSPKNTRTINAQIRVYDFLHGLPLANVMNESEAIICRSGYSSIMDLYFLEKPCILIPTPGQSEQEYLHKKHSQSSSSTLENAQPVKISLCKG